ncbi:hypothetical protein RclHR1_07430006 [Rhizophagus clarus]|uniref:GATA-type zinc finger transcription factor n=1 Tax=Rhizophagus clarus TaxID=94130 RepID=A0A2Z6RX67_9GLOM|nr:hypothetical protein RclHR1_07430006 [Rhizophagus clarus]GES86861.1 GATA-type zinc finger transcription factor [Rhizophagus clarus]
MPSTSSANKSINQRNSSTNYNESSIIPQAPRQILPMSRSTSVQVYQQPQIIVPTQNGFGDILPNSSLPNSKEMSTVLLSMDYFDNNMQVNCFGQVHPYQTYYPQQQQQQQQQQQIYSQQLQQQYFQLQQQHNQMIQQSSRVISRTMAQQHHSTSMNMTPSHVVPTQTLTSVQPLLSLDSTMQDVSQSISDYSMSASLSNHNGLPIDFSLDQSPTICYDESSDKKSCSKNSVLNDVFFSDPMIEDTEEVLHFDSDSSSDTDILTPRQRYSPPLSPIDLMSGDDLLWNIISYDLSKDKPSTETPSNMSEIAISSSELDVKSEVTSSSITTIPPPSPMITSPSNSSSNVTTIDPTLIRTTPETIDPRFIEKPTTSTSVAQNVVVKKLPPSVITRPNHIEFGDGIPSPPLRTPELVSDHSIKRRLSCESSSDDEISDAESRAQKKFRVDIKKSIKINDDKQNEEVEEESDSEEFSSVNDNDEDMDSTNEGHDISDTVTDEYHYSSDTDSEEDDDEEYRPTNNNKKSRTRKVVKTQGRGRGVLSKGSSKTKSSSMKNKSKVLSTKRGKQSSKTSKPSSKRSSGASTPASLPIESPPQSFATPAEESHEMEGLEVTSPRPTQSPTIFQTLTKSGIDWCRYCGTTEGVNWRPGPWGKRTLCNKHGCDYKGYGFACKLPRLDLTGFVNESVEDRDRPVLQLFCTICQKQESYMGNVLVRCEGCFKAFHQKCFSTHISDETVSSSEQWFCEAGCSDNVRRKRIVVELPRKKLPLMSTPKVQAPVPNIETGSVPSGTASRPRTSRNSSRV